jgi:hypothetical protein
VSILQRIPKAPKRSDRWKSQAHLGHVRKHACVNCGAVAPIEAAHVRMGSDAGMGRKPSDYYAVPLCRDCHAEQHTVGEPYFWNHYSVTHGHGVRDVLAELVKASPRRREIEIHREGGLANNHPPIDHA